MAWGLNHGWNSPKPKTTRQGGLILSNTLQIKKDLKTVHCCNNAIKLSKPLQCPKCIQEDKRKNGTYESCRIFYFHLKYCYREINYSINPSLETCIESLQNLSDKVLARELKEWVMNWSVFVIQIINRITNYLIRTINYSLN